MWRYLFSVVRFCRLCFLDGLMGPLAEFAGNVFGGNRDNKHAREMMDTNNLHSLMMAQNQYQYAVKDMQAAGLNPMLAYQQGGNRGAGGAGGAAPSSGIGKGVSSAIASYQSLKLNKAQVAREEAEADRARADAESIRAQTPGQAATSDRLTREVKELTGYRIAQEIIDWRMKDWEGVKSQMERSVVTGKDQDGRDAKVTVPKLVQEYVNAKFGELPETIRLKIAERLLKDTEREFYPWKLAAPTLGAAAGVASAFGVGKWIKMLQGMKGGKMLPPLGRGYGGPKGDGPSVFRPNRYKSPRQREQVQKGYHGYRD